MNHNAFVRFVVRLRTQKDGSTFMSRLPSVWTGGIRQLRAWAAGKGLQWVAGHQAEVLGGHYSDPSTGYEYYLDLK
jgi:hypothetical protein